VLAEQARRDERRRSRRETVALPARLRAGELTIRGELVDLSARGTFLATRLLVEVGERGVLEVDGHSIAVEVVWLRGNAGDDGPGMGLVFEAETAERERFRRRLAGG
jgi:hypothetical protein